MRSAIALITAISAVAFGCGETITEGSAPIATGGTSDAPGKDTGTTSATGGKSATGSKSASGGSSQTSARRSDAASGGTGARSSASGNGGKSPGTKESNGGDTAEEGGASATPTGGRTSGLSKPASGGKSSTGGQATGGKSVGPSAGGAGGKSSGEPSVGGQAAGGKTSNGTGVGGQAAGGDTGAPSSGKSAGCGKAPGITQYNNGQPISITAGGKQRRFILNVPTNYDNNHPYRLIIAYHQLDGNDKQLFDWKYYGLLPLSNNSTIFVAPNGQKNGSPCSGTGSGDSGCGWPNSGDSDLALADAVVAEIEKNFCVDTTRIFATGWSYGGSMSYRTGCSRPQGGTGASWGVRGIAIYSAAQLSGNCTPSKPVAFFAEHGTRDGVLNYDSMGLPLAQNFAKANGCTWATPTKVTSGTHVCTSMKGCMEGYPLEFCSFNGDHTPFPDNGQAQGSWGPEAAWKFLSQF